MKESCARNALPGWPPERRIAFLGLWSCPSDTCYREGLPSHQVAGEANEEQLMTALEVYAERLLATRKILNSLFNVVNEANATLHAANHCLELLLERMQRYANDKLVQISASASLFYLIRHLHIENISLLCVRKLVLLLVEALERYPQDNTVVRNCCLTLCKVKTPDQILFLYERLLKVLLRIAEHPPSSQDNFPQRIAMHLLNVIVCQVNDPGKRLFGDVGGVQVALTILEQRLKDNAEHDDVVDTCWSLLWNVTDETAPNCRLFIYLGGLELFVRCMKKWPDHKEL